MGFGMLEPVRVQSAVCGLCRPCLHFKHFDFVAFKRPMAGRGENHPFASSPGAYGHTIPTPGPPGRYQRGPKATETAVRRPRVAQFSIIPRLSNGPWPAPGTARGCTTRPFASPRGRNITPSPIPTLEDGTRGSRSPPTTHSALVLTTLARIGTTVHPTLLGTQANPTDLGPEKLFRLKIDKLQKASCSRGQETRGSVFHTPILPPECPPPPPPPPQPYLRTQACRRVFGPKYCPWHRGRNRAPAMSSFLRSHFPRRLSKSLSNGVQVRPSAA